MDYARRFLQAVKLVRTDEELARADAAVHPAHVPERASISASRSEGGGNLIFDPSNKLMEFRMLVGIISDQSFKAPRGFDPTHRPIVTIAGRPAPNVGIYTTVVDKEVKARKNYKVFSMLINCALGLQIVVAATLVALGASNSGRAGVVVFGAINTVIAGFLTYLKGSGLPNRLKYFQHEWDKVREYIEARERDLMVSEEAFDIYEQVEVIREMYETVKRDVENNTPDRFVSVGHLNPQPESSAARGPALSNRTSTLNGSVEDGGVEGKLSRMASSLSGNLGSVRKTVDSRVERFGDAEKQTQSFGNRLSTRAHNMSVHFMEQTNGLKDKVQDKVKELSDLEKQIESHGQMVLKQKEVDAQTKTRDFENMKLDLAARGSSVLGDHDSAILQLQAEIEERSRMIADLRARQLQQGAQLAAAYGDQVNPDVVSPSDTTRSATS